MIRELLADPIVVALLVLLGVVAGAWGGWYLRGTVARIEYEIGRWL